MSQKTQTQSDEQVAIPMAVMLFDVPQDTVQLTQDKDGPPLFEMIANSGKPMLGHGYFGNLGIDLSGVHWRGSKIPVLLDHDTSKRLGFTHKVEVTERGLVASGQFLSNADASSVLSDSKSGFPWQASVYLKASKVLRLEENDTHEVNGHEMKGPGYVFLKSELKEVTFTAFGADPHTSAAALTGNVAESVTASVSRMKPMANEPIPTPVPAVDEQKLRDAQAAGQAAERARVTRITQLAGSEQAELAQSLIASGDSIEEAAVKLHADLRARLSAKQESKPEVTAPLGAGNAGSIVTSDAAKLAAMPEGVEKWTKQWDTDATLHQEFTDKHTWLAFCRNQHRCRDYGNMAAFQGVDDKK